MYALHGATLTVVTLMISSLLARPLARGAFRLLVPIEHLSGVEVLWRPMGCRCHHLLPARPHQWWTRDGFLCRTPEQTDGLNHWRYEDDVFPLTAHPRLLSTWTLIEAWLRILQLLALLGVLTWSMFFLPEVYEMSHSQPKPTYPSLDSFAEHDDSNRHPALPKSQSGPLQQLRPADSAEAYRSSVSEYLAQSRATSDWLVLVCLPGMALGSAVGVLISWICLPASRWRALGFGYV